MSFRGRGGHPYNPRPYREDPYENGDDEDDYQENENRIVHPDQAYGRHRKKTGWLIGALNGGTSGLLRRYVESEFYGTFRELIMRRVGIDAAPIVYAFALAQAWNGRFPNAITYIKGTLSSAVVIPANNSAGLLWCVSRKRMLAHLVYPTRTALAEVDDNVSTDVEGSSESIKKKRKEYSRV